MKKSLLLAIVLTMSLLFEPGCKKKQPPPPPMPQQSARPGQPDMNPGTPAPEKKVVVPNEVRDTWKAMRVEVDYKEKKTKKRFVVPMDSEFKIPDSDLTLKAGSFLPDFKMGPDEITSGSNRPENPAAKVEVLEQGRKVFQGWLFAKYPDAHPFQHEKYGVTLVEGIRK